MYKIFHQEVWQSILMVDIKYNVKNTSSGIYLYKQYIFN